MTCEADRDFNSVLSFGKKRKKRQTIGDLQALLEKYHDAKLSGNVVLGEEPNERVGFQEKLYRPYNKNLRMIEVRDPQSSNQLSQVFTR